MSQIIKANAKDIELPLHSNPFHILGATVRDNRSRLIELVDDKSLVLDAAIVSKARTDLTTPKNRLAAEISWFPGLSPRSVNTYLDKLYTDPEEILYSESLPALTKANLVANLITILREEVDVRTWANCINNLAYASDKIDPEEVLRAINEDRSISGYPAIQSVDLIEEELGQRRRFYSETVRNAIDALDSQMLVKVVTSVADTTTDSGEYHAPVLVHDVIDRYEIEANRFLEPETENILKLIETIRENASKGEQAVDGLVKKLDQTARNWDFVAQPIQLSMKAQGLDHDLSHKIAWSIRSLCIELFNKHDMLETSRFLNGTLHDLFAELPEVVDQLEKDTEALDDIVAKRLHSQEEDADWAREITYEAEIGLVMKDRLKISPSGIEWKGRNIPLNDVKFVRWGAIRHSVNGIPTGTEYTIGVSNSQQHFDITTRRENVFDSFIQCLWRAVGVRLMSEYAKSLADGNTLNFGGISLDDNGVTLKRKKFFGSDDVYTSWNKISYYSSNGCLVLLNSDDKKVTAEASYKDSWNVHILEALIRFSFKEWKGRLSGVLS